MQPFFLPQIMITCAQPDGKNYANLYWIRPNFSIRSFVCCVAVRWPSWSPPPPPSLKNPNCRFKLCKQKRERTTFGATPRGLAAGRSLDPVRATELNRRKRCTQSTLTKASGDLRALKNISKQRNAIRYCQQETMIIWSNLFWRRVEFSLCNRCPNGRRNTFRFLDSAVFFHLPIGPVSF